MGFFFLFKRANDFVKGARVILFGKIVKISYYIYTTNFFPKIWGRPLPPKAKEWLRPCLGGYVRCYLLMMPKSSPVRCTILAFVAVAYKREQHRIAFEEAPVWGRPNTLRKLS